MVYSRSMKLDTPLQNIARLTPAQKTGLRKLKLETARDLLHYFPMRYESPGTIKVIKDIVEGERVSIAGTISSLDYKKTFKSRIAIATAILSDDTGSVELVWFHQPYIAKILTENSTVLITGTVSKTKKGLSIANPEYEKLEKPPEGIHTGLFGNNPDGSHALWPVYSETKGVTSKWIHHTIKKIIADGTVENITDPMPEDMLKRYNLPRLSSAIIWIHIPRREEDAEAARKRFAFQEIFLIQLEKQKNHALYEQSPSWSIHNKEKEISDFIKRFPYSLTKGQQKAIDSIMEDFKQKKPMSRLLEGDVGSGKTAVAATTALAVITTYPKGQDFGSLQVAYMCPTEILARQHFKSFIEYFAHTGVSVGLMTSSECQKFPSKVNPTEPTHISKRQLLKWVANGEIPILIGTHSLIQQSVEFKHLAYIIIDEQHRFGTAQRQKLAQKDAIMPHLLSMTATPIPRTLALTLYGDLDITVLDEMPHGRKPVITTIVLPTERTSTYEKIRKEINAGRQLYVICPRINEPDPDKEMALAVKSVKEEAEHLKKIIFPEYEIGILHSKMKPAERDRIMQDFNEGTIHILVATSVVEVGVNVPNATMIIIEGAERFGLAQLHQLRGRVIRSNHQAYCYVFADAKTEKTVNRLKALTEAKNGFELAEYDLGLRGAGMLYGFKQWGVSDLAMDAIKNIKLVEAARIEARRIVQEDISLEKYPLLKTLLDNGARSIHFE